VPSGSNVPLVLQVGKWRRQVVVPSVAACTDTVLMDRDLTRLPRSSAEGSLPRIAVTTGGSGALECLLREVGIADSEFTTDSGAGRVHLYFGGDGTTTGAGATAFDASLGGAALSSAATLWGSPSKLASYDLLLMSCEGSQYATAKAPHLTNMKAYADQGGRVFAEHLQSYWLIHGPPPWPSTASYVAGCAILRSPFTSLVDVSFRKGAAFSRWLVNAGASTVAGQLPLLQAQLSVSATTANISQRWLGTPDFGGTGGPGVEYMTFNTPVEAAASSQPCGRVGFADVHLHSITVLADTSDPSRPFPAGCRNTTLATPRAKAFELLLFDLAGCVQPDSVAPAPPPHRAMSTRACGSA